MIDKLTHWLNRESSSITVAALLLAAASFAADILGLVRDRVLASQFGAGEVLDIYYAGFRIPDLLLNILILGAMSSAFLPVFADRFVKSKDDAWRFASNLLTLAALGLIACAGILYVLVPWLLPFIVPGFDSSQTERAIAITRILLLSPILFGLSSIVSAILHFSQRFFFYSLAPILYNFGIILGAVIFAPRFGEIGLAFGVVLGAMLHLGIQIPAVRASGFRFRAILRPVHAAVYETVHLAIPRTANLVVNQLQFTALTALASVFAVGSIAVFNFGMNLAFVPIGVIGISFATAAFPILSRSHAQGDPMMFARTLRQTAQEILFFALPAAALLLVLRAHIVRVVLGSGAFTWEDTRLTAAVLGALALGVIAMALLPLLVRAFFAQKDTVTPFLVSFVAAVGTVVLALGLSAGLSATPSFHNAIGTIFRVQDLPDIRVLALPVAMTILATLQAAALLTALSLRGLRGEVRRLAGAAARMTLVAVVSGAVTWGVLQMLAEGVVQETFIGIFLQGVTAGIIGILVYLVLASLFAFPEFVRFLRILRRSIPPLGRVVDVLDVGSAEKKYPDDL